MTLVRLGNTAPVQGRLDRETGSHVLDDDGRKIYDPIDLDGPTETVVVPSEADSLVEKLRAVDDLWKAHSTEPPSWVWSDDPILEAVIAANFNAPAGLPDDVEETHYTLSGPPGVGVAAVDGEG